MTLIATTDTATVAARAAWSRDADPHAAASRSRCASVSRLPVEIVIQVAQIATA